MLDRANGVGFLKDNRRDMGSIAVATMIRRRWVVTCLLFLISAFPVWAMQPHFEPVTIQLRWFHQFQFAGYYAAIEKGFYADEGLQVSLREFEHGKDRIAPVLEGKAQ